MTPIKFMRYRPAAPDTTIIAERISHWYQVDYNGNYGTCIVLDTGAEITVGEWPQDVEKMVLAAIAKKGGVA